MLDKCYQDAYEGKRKEVEIVRKESNGKNRTAEEISTRSSAISPAIESSATAGTKRGRQAKSPGALREKRSKTRPLTAADIPDIVSAVVKAMPQSAEASSTSSTPRKRSSRQKQRNTDQPSQATRRRVTGMTPTSATDDSSNEADTDNEVFGKLCSSACYVRVM